MAKAMSLKPREYVLEFEREAPKEEQTIFILKPLSLEKRAELKDSILLTEIENNLGPKNEPVASSKMRHLTGTYDRKALEAGLVGIKNLEGPEGELLEFDQNTDPKKRQQVLDALFPDWVTEISQEIFEMSNLSKGEKKNSERQSSSTPTMERSRTHAKPAQEATDQIEDAHQSLPRATQ